GAAVGVALARLAQVGEPEAAVTVEDEIVRAAQLPSIARVVERLELAALGIDDLDAPAPVIVGLGDRKELARADHELEATVIGHVDLSARPHGRAVRAAAERGAHVDLS